MRIIRKRRRHSDAPEFVSKLIEKRRSNIEIMKAWEPTILALEELQNFVDLKCPKAIGAAEDFEKARIQAFLVELNNMVQRVNRKFEKTKTIHKMILKKRQQESQQ